MPYTCIIKKFISSLLLLLASQIAFAQKEGQALIDSLILRLEGIQEDTAKAILYGDIGFQYYLIEQNEKGLAYTQKQFALSEKINWEKGITLAHFGFGMYDYSRKEYEQAFNKMILSYNELTKRYHDFHGGAVTAQNICVLYEQLNDLENSRIWAYKRIDMCRAGNDRHALAEAFISLGMNYAWVGNIDSCIYCWEKAVEIQDSIGIKPLLTILDNLGIAYLKIHNGPLARKYYERSLIEKVNNKDIEAIGFCLSSIGSTYSEEHNTEKTIEYYSKAIEVYKITNNNLGIALVNDYIGAEYFKIGDYNNALRYYLAGLKIAEKVNDNVIYPVLLTDITAVYEKIKDYDKALEYLLKARTRFKITDTYTDSTFIITTVNMNISAIYAKMKNYDSALRYTHYALEVKSRDKNKLGTGILWGQIGAIYQEQGKYDEALKSYYTAVQVSDAAVEKRDLSAIFTNIGTTYLLVSEDSNKASLSDSLSKMPKKEFYRRSIANLNKALVFSTETGTTEYLIDIYSNLSKAYELNGNFKEALANHKLYLQLKDSLFNSDKVKEITSLDMQYDFAKKEDSTKAANDKKIALQKETHKANLAIAGISALSVIAFISGAFYFRRKRENDKFQLQLNETKQEALNAQMSDHFISNTMDSINHFIRNNDKEKASEYLILFSRLIRKVLENATEKMIPLNEDIGVLKDYLELEKLRFPEDTFHYDIHIDKTVTPHDTLIPPMVFQTLAENAIKHGFKKTEGGRLQFSIGKDKDTIVCSVEDNGIGRTASTKYKDPDSKGRISFGTSIAEKLIKTANRYGKETSYKITDLFDHNNVPSGTLVKFAIPYIAAE